MVFNVFLLISFYFFIFILPGAGIIFGIIELKNKISNKNAVSKIGTLFNIYSNKKFNNIIVYSEDDIIIKNPESELFKKIEPTSYENWYFVYVTDGYVYF